MVSEQSKKNFIRLARSWDKDYVAVFGRVDEAGADYEFLEMFHSSVYLQLGKKRWQKMGYSTRHVYDVWYNDLVE